MPSYQYRDSRVKDKTVSPTVLSLTWESPYLGKTVFILRRGPDLYQPVGGYASLFSQPVCPDRLRRTLCNRIVWSAKRACEVICSIRLINSKRNKSCRRCDIKTCSALLYERKSPVTGGFPLRKASYVIFALEQREEMWISRTSWR